MVAYIPEASDQGLRPKISCCLTGIATPQTLTSSSRETSSSYPSCCQNWGGSRPLRADALHIERELHLARPFELEPRRIRRHLHDEIGTFLSWIEVQGIGKTRKRDTSAALATGVAVSVVAGRRNHRYRH